MKNNQKHFDQDDLIEYFYKESPNPEEIRDHLRGCKSCIERYLNLKKDMESISDHFKQDFWRTQQKRIMAEVSQIQEVKESSWIRWLKPAIVTIVLIILFIGIYSRLNHIPRRYTEKDISDEIFLEHVAELVDQPLTSALDYLDFQEEEDQEENDSPYSYEKLEIFGYWSELGA